MCRSFSGGPSSPAKKKDLDLEDLDQEDQDTLEKKREELQRALAKEMKDIQEGKDKKRPRSSSSSSTSSSRTAPPS